MGPNNQFHLKISFAFAGPGGEQLKGRIHIP